MKLSKRILACAITVAMATSMLSACNGSTTTSGSASDAGTSQGNSSTTENSNSGDNSSTDGNGGSNGGNIVEAPSNGDTLKWLGYYDLNTDDKEIVDKFNDAGYKVETISTSSTEYFTKLAQLVASSDSPDMVRYEWQSYPHGVANNLYTSLDDYVDFDSDTWSGMKDMIENFNYGGKQNSEYSNPDTCLTDTKTLFAEFGLDWGWTTAQAAAKDQDIRFVPIPRDDKADKYYTNTDTFGYLVPAGAKNIKAALKYMEICRLNEIDPELIAKSKAEMTAEHLYYPKCPECGVSTADKTIEKCPSCGAARRERKKHSAMSEDLYQIYSDLKDTTSDKFTFLFDDCFGFSTDLTNMLQQGDSEGKGCVLGGPFKLGESYTNLRDTYYGTVESFLEPYRALMQKN